MGHLAKADGRVSEDEIRAAKNIMSRLELNQELRQEAMRLFTEGKNPSFNLEQALLDLYQECKPYSDLLRLFIEIQLEVALADGELQPEEHRVLLLICGKLRFSPKEFEQLWARQWASQSFHQWFSSQFNPNTQGYGHHSRSGGRSEGSHWGGGYKPGGSHAGHAGRTTSSFSNAASLQGAYGVLGVSANASPPEIKKAYRRLMNQHHPDKLASRGLPEGMIKLAKEKTQEITAAYNLVREAKGFR